MNNKKIILTSLSALAILFMSGCSAHGPKFSTFVEPTKGKAAVYFYRPSSFLHAESQLAVRKDINNSQGFKLDPFGTPIVAILKNNSYIKKEFTPGVHEFKVGFTSEQVELKADTYVCMLVEPGLNALFSSINSVDLSICKSAIQDTLEMTEEDEGLN